MTFGAIAYVYPGAKNLDFTEVYLNASYGPVEIGVANTVAADDSSLEGDVYTHLTLSKEIGPFEVSVLRRVTMILMRGVISKTI